MYEIENTNLEIDIYPTITINGVRHISDTYFYPSYEWFWEVLSWMKTLKYDGEIEFDIKTDVYLHHPIKSSTTVFHDGTVAFLKGMGFDDTHINGLRDEK